MSFGFGICDLINASRLAFELISSYVRASDDFKRETDYLTITLLHIRQECEMLDYSISHASLCEPRFLTRMVHDWGTTLKQLEQLLKELKIDDGTTSRRIGQLKRRLYVYIERLKKDLAPHMSKIQAWSLAQRCLLVPDDASAFLQILVEEPIDVPMSGAAGSMDNTPIIYGSDKNLVAMRAPRKRCLEGRDSSLSSLLCSQGATAREKSTLVQPLIDEGVCTNFMTSTIYSYGLGEQEFWNSSISVTCTTGLSQESYCIDGLDEGTVLVSSSKLSDLNDLYNSFTKCNSASYYPLPISSSEDLSYGSSADLWSDETPRQWSFLRSSLKRLGHATSRVSFRTSKLLTLVSPVFFASSVSAVASHCGSQNDPVRLKTGPQDYSTWFQALGNIQGEFLYLWTHRTSMSNDNSDPETEVQSSTILLACFLCTSCVALVAQAGRNDPYQTHIVGFCAMISSIAGALLTVNVLEFVFLYLFWGCLGGLAISLILHRGGAVTALKQRGHL